MPIRGFLLPTALPTRRIRPVTAVVTSKFEQEDVQMNTAQALFVAAVMAVSGTAIAGSVNVNKADAKTIDQSLNGVGAKTAEGIVKERANGPFKDEADLAKRVKGVGSKTLEKNRGTLKFAD
jgi:competence protein ComEA